MNKYMYGLLVACFATSAYAADASKVDAVVNTVEATTPVDATAPKAVAKPKLTQEQADALITNFSSRFATPKTERRFVSWFNSMVAFVKAHPYITAGTVTTLVGVSLNHKYSENGSTWGRGWVKTNVSDKAVTAATTGFGYVDPREYGNAAKYSIGTAEVVIIIAGLIYAFAQVEVEGEFESEDEDVVAPVAPAVVPAVPVVTETAVAPIEVAPVA